MSTVSFARQVVIAENMANASARKNTILIFSIGSLGDTLVALPAYHLIRERYPDSRIVLLTNSPVDGGVKAAPSHQILLGSGLVDDYLEYQIGRAHV